MEPYDQTISLGYRCSSAGILKSLGLKTESYPFDWLVSRLPVIEDCIQTDFREFLSPDNYKCTTGVTNNYTSTDPASQQWICNESFCFNEYYERPQSQIENMKYYLPQPISTERDAYGYKLMMNHRNIKTNKSDQEYFARCVERWKSISITPLCVESAQSNVAFSLKNCPDMGDLNEKRCKKRLALYIHPAVFYEEFLSIKLELIGELKRAYQSISITHPHDGIYIIPVKTPFEYPTNHCCKYVLEEQPDDPMFPRCRICILWTNLNFIDAGEIFMGNSYVETYVIKDYLYQTVNNRNLLDNSAST